LIDDLLYFWKVWFKWSWNDRIFQSPRNLWGDVDMYSCWYVNSADQYNWLSNLYGVRVRHNIGFPAETHEMRDKISYTCIRIRHQESGSCLLILVPVIRRCIPQGIAPRKPRHPHYMTHIHSPILLSCLPLSWEGHSAPRGIQICRRNNVKLPGVGKII